MSELNISVVSDEEAEKASAVVCMRKGFESPFDDNVEGVCSVCNHAIIYRPYMPIAPPKICYECMVAMVSETKQ